MVGFHHFFQTTPQGGGWQHPARLRHALALGPSRAVAEFIGRSLWEFHGIKKKLFFNGKSPSLIGTSTINGNFPCDLPSGKLT